MNQEDAKESAKKMLQQKRLDAVCLNILNNSDSFGTSDNEIEFITKENTILFPREDKLSLSFKIIKNAKALQES
jgi:phosphopantothenoylcysteine decarboxylase/phosphopantothenate--cysteine ligase